MIGLPQCQWSNPEIHGLMHLLQITKTQQSANSAWCLGDVLCICEKILCLYKVFHLFVDICHPVQNYCNYVVTIMQSKWSEWVLNLLWHLKATLVPRQRNVCLNFEWRAKFKPISPDFKMSQYLTVKHVNSLLNWGLEAIWRRRMKTFLSRGAVALK